MLVIGPKLVVCTNSDTPLNVLPWFVILIIKVLRLLSAPSALVISLLIAVFKESIVSVVSPPVILLI